jgi:hypothetical protein
LSAVGKTQRLPHAAARFRARERACVCVPSLCTSPSPTGRRSRLADSIGLAMPKIRHFFHLFIRSSVIDAMTAEMQIRSLFTESTH